MKLGLSALPAQVAASALVETNGEVMWRDVDSVAAINALADAGLVILGLDVRFYDANNRFYEIAWSSFDPNPSKSDSANAVDAREAALERLAKIDEQDRPDDTVERRVLITWR